MLKKFAQCLGLASLILLENYSDFLAGGGTARMHVPFALGGIVLAQVADILLLAVLLFVVIAPLSRTKAYPVVRLLLAMGIPLYFLGRVKALLPFGLPPHFAAVLTVVWPGLLLVLYLWRRQWYRPAMVFASNLGAAFAVFATLSMAQLLMLTAWKPGSHEKVAERQTKRDHARLVWIVFDELSYNQVFEHRAVGLALPNFDALRGESTVYSNAQPIGLHTVSILPSLLSGKAVDDYRFRWGNTLDLHFDGERGWHPANGQSSVFGDAQAAGWRTAAVGWYNPYCTVYDGSLDDCYWMNRDKIEGPMAQDRTLAENVWMPLSQLGRRAVSSKAADEFQCDFDVKQHLRSEQEVSERAMAVVRADQDDLVFLHLGVPHSPNIWDRKAGAYRAGCGGSYLDGLALADVELGKVMAMLKESPRWAETTLIVQGDHSWRTMLWHDLPAWTAEDEAASKGAFDPRPAVMVHGAGQSSGAVDSSAWSLIRVHEVVESVLHGRPKG